MGAVAERKQRGAWYTPDELVATIVTAVVTASWVNAAAGRRLHVVDPACGDGRFLLAVADRVVALGGSVHLVGVDIDGGAVAATQASLRDVATGSGIDGGAITFDVVTADALALSWPDLLATTNRPGFDLVVGNPPFLSQLAAATTRGGASRRGGGPYADAAAEFLALAAELVDRSGRVAFVLPQSLLSARDAAAVRARYDERATLIWSRWTGEREFDAQVLTCALAFEFGSVASDGHQRRTASSAGWAQVVTSRRGVPDLPSAVDEQGAGRLGDRARLNANFRDEYYGMIPAVGDHADGPALITSGLIDPGRSLWGQRPVRFAKRRFERPRVDVDALDSKMTRWAAERLVPKVMIANQTTIIEALADPDGACLPGVPVVSAYPHLAADRVGAGSPVVWEIAAVLTSPVASAWAWHRNAGTGLSADAIRVGPALLADLPWPRADLAPAVAALRRDDVRGCGAAVHAAFGLDGDADVALTRWWLAALARIDQRRR